MASTTLTPISRPHRIEVPFVTVEFGGQQFGLMTDTKNSKTGMVQSDFIKSLTVNKYGSGAVNTYTLTLVYVITPESDPNFVDLTISKASDRVIYFTYGDRTQPEYSYKGEQAIITSIVPSVDYSKSTITYTITATSSTTLSYALKVTNFPAVKKQPSQVIIEMLRNTNYGIRDLLPGMANVEDVLANGWIPQDDVVVEINEKSDISPMDYILYLVSLMKSRSGNYYFLKVFDSTDNVLPHFEIISTSGSDSSSMLTIDIGYPGSIPIYDFTVSEDSSIALLVDYRDSIDSGLYQDYSFRGDLITKDYYKSETVDGTTSANLKNWWDKMMSFPISATLTMGGLYLPAQLIQSIYINCYFYGKRYNHSGEYMILEQTDEISKDGYKTTLSLLRINN